MMSQAVATTPGRIEFTLGRGPLAWLLLRIAVLNLLTLGFYRFWGKTRLRSSFWSALSVGGERFEYTGRAVELLLGFLMALAVLAPLYGAASVAQIAAATTGEAAVALVQIATFLAVVLLWPIAIYRARRYRLTRTLWRGIRFGQDGSALRFAAMTLGYWCLTLMTAWLAYPWMRVALQRYKMRNTRYGRTAFEFELRGSSLFPDWIMVWAAMVAIVVAVAVLSATLDRALNETETPPQALLRNYGSVLSEAGGPLLASALALLAAFVTAGLLLVRYYLAEVRLFFGGTTLAGISFEAQPRVGVVLYIGLVAATATIGFILAFLLVFTLLAWLNQSSVLGPLGTFSVWHWLIVALFLFFVFFLWPLVRYVFVYVPFLRHLTSVLAISDLAALDTIVQDDRARPATGEGLADALDVGGI